MRNPEKGSFPGNTKKGWPCPQREKKEKKRRERENEVPRERFVA